MIQIIGDTSDELSFLQKIIESGILNSTVSGTIDVTYKLSSGGALLADQYNHIIGKKELYSSGLDADDFKKYQE